MIAPLRNVRAAVIGGSECGKTTLAAGLSLGLWNRHKLRTLAFDPWLKENPRRWGKHAWATDEMTKFEHVVFSCRGCCVVWDEGTSTGGRERDKVKFFTAVRHNHPAFFFLGHQYSAMLPVMRNSLTDVFLFRSNPDEATQWANIMTDPALLAASELPQFACLQKRAFSPVEKRAHTAQEIFEGILP